MSNILQETRIIRLMIILPIVGVILTSFVLTNIFLSSKVESANYETAQIEKNYIQQIKNTIHERIVHINLLFNNNYIFEETKIKKELKDTTDLAHKLLSDIYKLNKDLPKEELFSLINTKMSSYDFFKDSQSYFFIYDTNNGKIITIPKEKGLVGKSLKVIKGKKGKNLLKSFNKTIEKNKEGFDSWFWEKNNQILEKIVFIKDFKDLNIAVATATYKKEIKDRSINYAINFAKNTKFNDNSYVFIIENSTKKTLYHKNSEIIGVPYLKLNKKIQKNVSTFVNSVKNNEGSFLTYIQDSSLFKETKPSKKISYMKNIKNLDITIGTGLYTTNLQEQIKQRSFKLNKELSQSIQTTIIISSAVTIIIIIVLLLLSRRIKKAFELYSIKLDSSHNELKSLNDNLEQRIQEQVSDMRKKDSILYQQSKMASMGEMIGNIAHQWRQPLSAISTTASGIKVQQEFNLLEEKDLNKGLDSIVENTKLLSQTIDDFRNFFNPKKEKSEYFLKDLYDKTYKLILPGLKNKNIKILNNIEDFNILNYENELIQVLLNILNNARDQLLLNKELEDKIIIVDIFQENDSVIIEIKDNAGGIKEDIIEKIYEPYFTTKFSSQGTGIGLYMTKEIIEKSFKGTLVCKNITFTNNQKEEKGALFRISFPK